MALSTRFVTNMFAGLRSRSEIDFNSGLHQASRQSRSPGGKNKSFPVAGRRLCCFRVMALKVLNCEKSGRPCSRSQIVQIFERLGRAERASRGKRLQSLRVLATSSGRNLRATAAAQVGPRFVTTPIRRDVVLDNAVRDDLDGGG